MNELKNIDFSKKYFVVDGRKFYVKESISIARYRELQKLIMEFGYSATFIDIFKNLRIAWDHLNNLRLGDAAVMLHNIMYGIKSLDDKDDPALRICALFIDEEGEDPAVYDEGKMREKVDCWRSLSVTPFFQLASSLVPNWIDAYKIVSQTGLKAEKKENA